MNTVSLIDKLIEDIENDRRSKVVGNGVRIELVNTKEMDDMLNRLNHIKDVAKSETNTRVQG